MYMYMYVYIPNSHARPCTHTYTQACPKSAKPEKLSTQQTNSHEVKTIHQRSVIASPNATISKAAALCT